MLFPVARLRALADAVVAPSPGRPGQSPAIDIAPVAIAVDRRKSSRRNASHSRAREAAEDRPPARRTRARRGRNGYTCASPSCVTEASRCAASPLRNVTLLSHRMVTRMCIHYGLDVRECAALEVDPRRLRGRGCVMRFAAMIYAGLRRLPLARYLLLAIGPAFQVM